MRLDTCLPPFLESRQMQQEISHKDSSIGPANGTAVAMSFGERLSSFNRYRKWRLFIERLAPGAQDRILDIGYTDLEWRPTDNLLEKHYPYRNMITALGVDEPVHFDARYPEVETVQYDGERFPFADDSFEIAWSNAVLEHVGTEAERVERQTLFLSEIRRVARRAFITTPNRWFPLEIHTRTPFLHWLPKRTFDAYLRKRGIDWAAGDYMTLLSEQDLRARLAAAGIERYELVKNRMGPFTADFVVVID
jgi:hypothetical protein